MKSRKTVILLLSGFALTFFGYFFYSVNFLVSDNYTIIEGSSIDAMLPLGIYTDTPSVQAGNGGRTKDGVVYTEGRYESVTLKVFNLVPVKDVSVKTVKPPVLYPSGECVGIKMFSSGLLVSGFTDFETEDGICVSPGAISGLREGDIIKSINGRQSSSVGEFSRICDSADGRCTLDIIRDGRISTITVNAQKCTDGHMRMGIYVKNSVAGVGTMTYINSSNSFFATLGHGISDYGTLFPLKNGSIYKADIIDIKKGQKGEPGEIIGAISEDQFIGTCISNTEEGVYGISKADYDLKGPAEVMPSSQVTKGRATILCSVNTDDIVREYDARIISVNRLAPNKTKSFCIKITDEELIRTTGGIVQGMSGSPILQNGKLVGAVTHVFVNDPTKGYGIFIENMLAEAEKIK